MLNQRLQMISSRLADKLLKIANLKFNILIDTGTQNVVERRKY